MLGGRSPGRGMMIAFAIPLLKTPSHGRASILQNVWNVLKRAQRMHTTHHGPNASLCAHLRVGSPAAPKKVKTRTVFLEET